MDGDLKSYINVKWLKDCSDEELKVVSDDFEISRIQSVPGYLTSFTHVPFGEIVTELSLAQPVTRTGEICRLVWDVDDEGSTTVSGFELRDANGDLWLRVQSYWN